MKLRTSFLLLGLLASWAVPASASTVGGVAVDSLDLLAHAQDAQADFEHIRVAYAPIHLGSPSGSCDEVIGRMCLRYLSGLPDDWTPPPENPRVIEGRERLLETLSSVGDNLPGDRWVLGQRIAYLGEIGAWERADQLARLCQSERWWCLALQGTTAHFLGETEAAEAAFAAALQEMPEELASSLEEIFTLVDRQLEVRLREAPIDARSSLEERLWVLADPLFLRPGNDVRTAHYARHTLAGVRSEGENPYGFRWGEDLYEIFVRYGAEVAFQQIGPFRPGVLPIPIVGRFDPEARGFFPEEVHLLAPEEIAVGAWSTGERAVRSRYAPTGSPRIGGIELQQARFRRGEDLLLVLGWRLAETLSTWEESSASNSSSILNPIENEEDPATVQGEGREHQEGLESALYLLPLGGDLTTPLRFAAQPRLTEGVPPNGLTIARAPIGNYLLSLELLDVGRERGWRARHGIKISPPLRGVPSLSDLLLLSPSPVMDQRVEPDQAPDSLERHLDRVLPVLRVEGDSVEVAWEVYGLEDIAGQVSFSLSVLPDGGGALRRALTFLRLVSVDPPIRITWNEEIAPFSTPARNGVFFRRITLDLSPLPTGPSKLVLTMQMPGREDVISEVAFERSGPGD